MFCYLFLFLLKKTTCKVVSSFFFFLVCFYMIDAKFLIYVACSLLLLEIRSRIFIFFIVDFKTYVSIFFRVLMVLF